MMVLVRWNMWNVWLDITVRWSFWCFCWLFMRLYTKMLGPITKITLACLFFGRKGTNENSTFLECHTVSLLEYFPTFSKVILPSYSGWSSPKILDYIIIKVKVLWSFKTQEATHPVTEWHIPEDLNHQQLHSENLHSCGGKKFCTVVPPYPCVICSITYHSYMKTWIILNSI
jgi:hypothetical protein